MTLLTAHPSRGFTISEIVKYLGMNIASAHATLNVLCDFGFLLRDPAHRTYVLGPALAVTGFAALEQHPAIEATIAQAELLAEDLEAEVGVSAIAGRDVVLLARRGPEQLTSGLGYPGDRSPMLAPFGAVFMAWAEEADITAWLERASLSTPVADHYRDVLADIRARGFSVPLRAIAHTPAVAEAIAQLRDEPAAPEAEQHLAEALRESDEMLLSFEGLSPADQVEFTTVAAPIFDPIGRVLLSLSITGPDHAVSVERILELGRRLVQSAGIATRQARGRAR
jgi:DNA-binding IclR family transcriptional regulator